jgi:hypothetical protein
MAEKKLYQMILLKIFEMLFSDAEKMNPAKE